MKYLLLILLAWTPLLRAADQPNIVIVMTDDQGYGDLGVMGNPVLETPHIDAMAARSASVDRFYVSPVCAPTRACLMTGRYNYRTRAVDTWIGRAMMEPDELTIAEMLRAGGYATGIFGKWHLGDCYPTRAMDQGFEESLVHRGGGLAQPSEPLENDRRYTDPILWHNGEQVKTRGYCTDVYFDAALAWMGKQEKPFFIYLPMNAPHGPFDDVPDALYRKYKGKDLSKVWVHKRDADKIARIYAMNENVDQNMGKLFKQFDTAGITDNTIVIYLHDNGANGPRYSKGLRGVKAHVHEGGIRTPFFFHWPKAVKAGTRVNRIAAHIDLAPTLLAAAGIAPPKEHRFDGRNILPFLKGEQVTRWPERRLFIQSHRGDAPERFHHFAAIGSRWKLLRASGFGREQADEKTGFELYDLLADPGEKKNLAGEQPEQVAKMKKEYEAWFDDVSATRKDNYAAPRIVLGTEHETETWLTHQDWREIEGPGWGSNGNWLVRVAADAVFDVQVRLLQPAAGKAELTMAGASVSKIVPEPTGIIHFKDLKVPAGEGKVRFELVNGEKAVGPYHVGVFLKSNKE